MRCWTVGAGAYGFGMSSVGKRWSKAGVVCPSPGHGGYVAIESPKGELGVHVVSDGGTRPYRAHFREPSFNNLQAVAAVCEGGQLADVIVAVASIDPVMGGVDR